MVETWKDIKGYEGLYQVSDVGNVRRNGVNLKPGIGKNGYPLVVLSKNGRVKTVLVHRIVAETFIPNPSNFKCVNHKDETRDNNRVHNLEWCDHRYNNSYGHRMMKEVAKKSRAVEQWLQGELVQVWSSTKEAERNGYSSGCISLCCNGKRPSHLGYEWRWSL